MQIDSTVLEALPSAQQDLSPRSFNLGDDARFSTLFQYGFTGRKRPRAKVVP